MFILICPFYTVDIRHRCTVVQLEIFRVKAAQVGLEYDNNMFLGVGYPIVFYLFIQILGWE